MHLYTVLGLQNVCFEWIISFDSQMCILSKKKVELWLKKIKQQVKIYFAAQEYKLFLNENIQLLMGDSVFSS